MIVAIGLEASDRVLLFELEIVDQSLEQVASVRHLLEAGEQAWLTSLSECFLLSSSHVRMVPDLRYPYTRLWICVQNLLYDVFALGGEELGHLVISGHDLLVQVRRLRVLERQIAGHHGVEDDAAGPDVRLQAVITLASDHLKL